MAKKLNPQETLFMIEFAALLEKFKAEIYVDSYNTSISVFAYSEYDADGNVSIDGIDINTKATFLEGGEVLGMIK